MQLYATIRDYQELSPPTDICLWNIDYDSCRVINGACGVVQLRAANDIEARDEFTRYMAARGNTVKWCADLDAAWRAINGD